MAVGAMVGDAGVAASPQAAVTASSPNTNTRNRALISGLAGR